MYDDDDDDDLSSIIHSYERRQDQVCQFLSFISKLDDSIQQSTIQAVSKYIRGRTWGRKLVVDWIYVSSRNSEIRVLLSHTPSTRLTPASLKADNLGNHRRLDLLHCQSEFGVLYHWKLRPDFGVTGYSNARTPILGEMYIGLYNYILSVIVVKVPMDRETSPRTQTAVSALFEDRLMASIQVVTKRQSPLFRPSASILVATRRQSLLSRPSKTIS